MNALIEFLNHWGERAIGFAGPMLWQSSLLIALLFTLDLVFRRKVRASIRYALWLVVLLKLLLPPSLALPTSLAWWVRPSAPPATPARLEPTTTFLVTYRDTVPLPAPIPAGPILVSPPSPSLSTAGWVVLGWTAISAGLLAWMLVRWRMVARDVRRATFASDRLKELLNSARSTARVSRSIELRVTTRTMSPAVCGLFRPVILLPQSLVARLTSEQLRAVLLHELIHLRRGDVWVNCLQTLLQILYWWHPLLWLANAFIRSVREEAVDDAVMLALAEDADAYAPTLLEVAKRAFHHPLASLGLVGILESRSALHQRIKRLVDFRPPRKAGLTIVSVLCVLAFGALAVPMEKAPATLEITDSKLQGGARTNAYARFNLKTALHSATNVLPTAGDRIARKLDQIRFERVQFDGAPLEDVIKWLTDKTRECDPEGKGILFLIGPIIDPTTGQLTEPAETKATLITINPPLSDARLADVLVAVVKAANNRIKCSVERYSVVFSQPDRETPPLFTRTFKINTNQFYANLITLGVLDELPPGQPPDPLRDASGTNFMQKVSIALNSYLSSLGVDLNPLLGKSMFFKDRAGLLLVRATMTDLDAIEQALTELSAIKPQIQIEARFVEMTQADSRALDSVLNNVFTKDGAFTNSPSKGLLYQDAFGSEYRVKGKLPPQSYGILTDPQYRVVLRAFEQRSGVDVLSAPRVTTLSGRQAQIQSGETRSVVTAMNLQALIPPGITGRDEHSNQLYQTNSMRFGSVLEVTPTLSADGYTVSLSVNAAVTEFLGYDENANSVTAYINGKREQVARPLPRFRSRETSATANVWDGQTLVLLEPQEYLHSIGSNGAAEVREITGSEKKPVVVFVSVRLVDESGNPVHTEEEMPFARDSIPLQTTDPK